MTPLSNLLLVLRDTVHLWAGATALSLEQRHHELHAVRVQRGPGFHRH